MDDG
jgi:hypothetical protein